MAGKPRWQSAGKREPEKENEVLEWIKEVTGETISSDLPYEDILRDGTVLCKLMNKLSPGSIPKFNQNGGQFKFMENISKFQEACKIYGVPEQDVFQTSDLWERKDVAMVTTTLFALGRTTYKHPEWQGPWLGPKPASQNRRTFTEEQLRAGEAVIGLQYGTNKGATQSGQSFGATRKILLGK
ncbi:muscle-specific protein 20-like isoform X1 [Artemia franciscana]|uniref:Transgelin n=1 Tax=Artemia franciscana TaxID=6661 RepID=A0AA88H4Y3_ARTSF|nr:hypothetical protein QYM36_018146 [Artemia franciscana]